MAEIKIGDLVSWKAGQKTKVGVVRNVNEDGSCMIDLTTAAGHFEERISGARLSRLTSTTEPEQPVQPE
ncbi:MAG: hypothetical protein NTZ78_05575 [Candidatus Aureabacteria bacterium]|nr:hypothetical protein [Candidatus Auribacterota bacterium]